MGSGTIGFSKRLKNDGGGMISPMKRIALVQSLVCVLACSQSDSTGQATGTGTCNSASTNSNRFTFTCNISKEQGEALLRIVNQILERDLDPSSVIGELNEIARRVQDIQKQAADRIINESQVAAMSRILHRSPGKSVYIVLLGDREANDYGRALAKIFSDSRWKVKINQIETLAIPAYGIYATANPTLLGALAEAGVSVRGTGEIPGVPRGTPAVLVGLKP
jgi:hypothetical protein